MANNYIEKLPDDAVQIENTLCWATPDGNIYGVETRTLKNKYTGKISQHKHYGEYFKYAQHLEPQCGYMYVSLKYINPDGSTYKKTRRVNVIIAQTFIPNPDNLPVVGHRNNIKTDNKVNNLYWTTYAENTQKAVDDGLMVNDVGYDDSQSHPVVMFDTYTGEEMGRYGSARQAHKKTGHSLTTILRQCKYKKPVRKPFYFRFQDDPCVQPPAVVVQYDYQTDEEIGRYWNTFDASRKTGINAKTIGQQCNNGWKPKTKTKSGTYFLYK